MWCLRPCFYRSGLNNDQCLVPVGQHIGSKARGLGCPGPWRLCTLSALLGSGEGHLACLASASSECNGNTYNT